MSDWKKVRLGDISDVQTGPFGSQLHKEDYVRNGTPIVTVEHLGNKQLNTDNLPCVKDADRERLSKYIAYEGDVIFSRVGSVDRCSYVDKKTNGWLFSGRCLRVRPFDDVSGEYLYYYFNLYTTKQYIRNAAVGTTMPSINTSILSEVPILLPSIEEQRSIASILSSLDDKIAVSKKICENLEAQAQALFKHWFVDFAPFKDGKFVESELGLIPDGWRVGNLFDIASIFDKIRKPLPGKDREFMNKIYPYYGATSCMDYVDSYLFDGIYTLIGEDGSVAKEDGLPYMQYVWGKFWVNNHAHILQGKNGFSTEMVHVFLSRYNIKHLVTGAVQAKLSQANMQKIMLPIPPKDVINKIRPVIDSLYEKIRNCEEESLRLSALRDTLLPKLMSGQIKVNEIEKSL